MLDDIHEFFEIFAKHTEDIQAQKYPTLQRTIPTFITILRQLRVLQSHDRPPELQRAAEAAHKLMYKYYKKSLVNRASSVATILDPRYKDRVFTWLEEEGGDDIRVQDKAKAHFKTVFNRYQSRQSHIETYKRTMADEEWENQEIGEIQDQNAWRDPFFEFRDTRVYQVRSELDRYLNEPLVDRSTKDSHLRVAEYWKAHQYDYPILSQMARDFLAIPALRTSL